MTKLISPLFCFLVLTVNAQQWPQPGAQWSYCLYDIMWPQETAGSVKKYYTRDSLIAGKLYNVIETDTHSVDTLFTYYTRFSNDTVYRWVNNQEYLFFHFLMHEGEYITTYRSFGGFNDTTCSEMVTYQVMDSTSVIINGEELTQWSLWDTAGWISYTVFERLGFESAFWFWNPAELADCGWFSDPPQNYLGLYSDDTYSNNANPCPQAGIEEESSKKVIVFPNPAADFLNTVEPFQGYRIIAVDGKIVAEENTPGNKIPVESLLPGTYFISFQIGDDQIVRSVFVKE